MAARTLPSLSLSLLPRHLTTTLIFVSSPSFWSKSRSFLFSPAVGGSLGDRICVVLPEDIESAGDSDRPMVDVEAFGLAGGRIEPRFAGCGREGSTMASGKFGLPQAFQ